MPPPPRPLQAGRTNVRIRAVIAALHRCRGSAMRKPAETSSPLHELIPRRRSPRPLRSGPSSRRKSGAFWRRPAGPLPPQRPALDVPVGDQGRAGRVRPAGKLPGRRQLVGKEGAPLLLAVAALQFAHNGKPNGHAFHDVGLANENLVLQARAMGLVVHRMAGFVPTRAREPSRFRKGRNPSRCWPSAMRGVDQLPDTLAPRETTPRSRKPLAEMTFSGIWGTTWKAIEKTG